ncbi:MAG: phage polymerase-related protein, partial [Hyphomicrobiales bacterium]|nr:phage polymerase-related protein [Hyphomicrobiales bacterium]
PLAASADHAVNEARARAAAALTLEELRANLEGFEGCALKRGATHLVFGDGDPKARVMLVGDSPSGDDDREGQPFAGPPGRLLDRMLGSIGLTRAQVYVSNIAPWRPPGNRKLSDVEIAVCLPFAQRQIELVAPDILVCLGDFSSQALLGVKEGIMRARGKAYEYPLAEGRNIRAFVMLNPAFLMRSSRHKRQTWADLRALRKAMASG